MKDNLNEKFLIQYLSNLSEQTFKDFEVVISDQSTDDSNLDIVKVFEKVLDITYVRNTSNVKNAANNVNHGIKYAKGELLKLLYMDDFFVNQNALHIINENFKNNPNNKWLISGFIHCSEDKSKYYDARLPWYGNKHVNGDNTTGNPSNYTVRRECALEMDENLVWIVDGEYFYRSYYHYGDPILLNEILVCFRDHGDSAFRRPDLRELDAKERQYCIDKYNGVVEHKLI